MGEFEMRNTFNDKVKAGFVCAICLTFLLCALTIAQEVSSTSGNGTGSGSTSASQDDSTTGGFTIKSSIEFGIRLTSIKGSENKYKSDLNYKEGARLFDSSFYATAEDGEGKPFDSLLINSSGWGADPNGYFRLSMEKTGWYKFDTTMRRFKYYNNLLNFALNEHNRNTQHHMGDFDVTILPQNDLIKFRAGFSFDKNWGPGSATMDYDRDEFPIEYDFDTRSFDTRFGVDLNLGGLALSFTEGYRNFKEDTRYFIEQPQEGEVPGPASWDTFERMMPIDGRTFYHKLTGHKYFKGVADVTGRVIYSDNKTDFTLDERITGITRFGNPIVLDEFTSSGGATRPNLVADIGATFFVNDRIRISNTFDANTYRIAGSNTLLDTLMTTDPMGNPLPTSISDDFTWRFRRYEGYRNTLEGDVDVNRYFSFFLGWRYTHRKIELFELEGEVGDPLDPPELHGRDTFKGNTLLAGFQAKPFRNKWVIRFDMEHGQGDNPFTRLSNKDYTQIRLKNQFMPRDDLSIGVSFETKDNSNPGVEDGTPAATLAADVKSRNFGVNVNYAPDPNFSFNGGYNYTYLNAETNVIFPFASQGYGVGFSIYDLRNNYFFVDAFVRPHPKFSIFGAYRISKDTGDGDSADLPNYLIMGNYPLTFQSPEVRGTLKLFPNADVNIGYQYYDYKEKFNIGQNYRAHLPYISVTIYLGRKE